MAKTQKKRFKWWLIPVIAAAVLALVLLGGRLWFRLPVLDYYRASEAMFQIPDISAGFVPQGLEYVPEEDLLLMIGYDKDGGPSHLYAMNGPDWKTVKKVTITQTDGELCHAHCGGLAVHDGRLYLCDSTTASLRVFRLTDLLAAQDGGTICEVGSVPLTAENDVIGPAFVEAASDGLLVGEFYIAKSYETPLSHHVDDHHALAVLLPYDDSELGVSCVPAAAYSLPDKAQGVCFDEAGRLFVSESWGAAFSDIEVFALGQPDREIQVLGVTVPLTVLNEKNRVSAVKIAPMSEELAIVKGKLFVNCESASLKYIFGRLNGAEMLHATDLAFFAGK